MSAIQQLAKLLGLSEEHATDSLTSERAARAVLSRRDFFAAGAAMASATAFAFPLVEDDTLVLCTTTTIHADGSVDVAQTIRRKSSLRIGTHGGGFEIFMGPDTLIHEMPMILRDGTQCIQRTIGITA